jgi:DNA-binding NtrC family response regulator
MLGHRANTTILVVEDDMLIRMLGIDIFQDADFNVLEAGDADDALVILTQPNDVGVLFSDVDMPGNMNGVGLARHVHELWPAIRILLTSGHHHLEKALLPSIAQVVPKPWTRDVLIERVCSVLRA